MGHCLLYVNTVKPHIFNTDTEGAIESVRIDGVSVFRENIRVFFSQGQSKLSVILMCPYKAGVGKGGFDCSCNLWIAVLSRKLIGQGKN